MTSRARTEQAVDPFTEQILLMQRRSGAFDDTLGRSLEQSMTFLGRETQRRQKVDGMCPPTLSMLRPLASSEPPLKQQVLMNGSAPAKQHVVPNAFTRPLSWRRAPYGAFTIGSPQKPSSDRDPRSTQSSAAPSVSPLQRRTNHSSSSQSLPGGRPYLATSSDLLPTQAPAKRPKTSVSSPVCEANVSSPRVGKQPSQPNTRRGLAALQSKLHRAKREKEKEQTQEDKQKQQIQEAERKRKAASKQHEKLAVTILADLMSTKTSQAPLRRTSDSPGPPSAAGSEKAMDRSEVTPSSNQLEQEEEADDKFFDRKGCTCAKADQPPVWHSYTGREPPTNALKRRVEAVSMEMGLMVPEPSTKLRRRCSMVVSHERAVS